MVTDRSTIGDVEWQDPPERKGLVFTHAVLDELRANPGRWALMRSGKGHRTPGIKHPADIELQTSYRGSGRERTYAMYARAKP
jgi:hypothetical protein